jgi:hypothetical protein
MSDVNDVCRAAFLLGLSALRNLPADMAEKLDQSASLDGRLNVVEANFEGKDAKNVK